MQKPTIPAWQTCPICARIPPHCRSFTKGGETLQDTLPPEAGRLQVVGAPFFNTDTSSSNRCLLKCPHCGTLYAWEFCYEYLVNGSEDDLELTRLAPAEGAEREQAAWQAVAEHRRWFLSQAEPHLAALRRAPRGGMALKRAAEFFFMQGPRRGVDITFALPELTLAYGRVGQKNPLLWTLRLALEAFGGQSEANVQALRGAFSGAGMENHPRAESVLAMCQNLLRQKEERDEGYG